MGASAERAKLIRFTDVSYTFGIGDNREGNVFVTICLHVCMTVYKTRLTELWTEFEQIFSVN